MQKKRKLDMQKPVHTVHKIYAHIFNLAWHVVWCLNYSRSAVSLIYLFIWQYEAQCFEDFQPGIVSFNMYSVLCYALFKL